MKNKKIIITYGTFDLFHYGHLKILQRAKELGDKLIVAISSDEFNELKNKKSIYSLKHRLKIVESIKFVDQVIIENSWNQKKEDIKKYNVDVLVMGDDWIGKFDDLKKECDVVCFPRTKNISSTKTKLIILENKNGYF